MGLEFEHRPISLFRPIPAFSAINPLLKAPIVTTHDGVVLMESSDIPGALAALHPELPSLWPADAAKRVAAASLTGIALTVGEKAVLLFYEGALRPPEAQYGPWRERVADQFDQGLGLLEAGVPSERWIGGGALGQADIDVACMVAFARMKFPDRVGAAARWRDGAGEGGVGTRATSPACGRRDAVRQRHARIERRARRIRL